MPKQTLYTRDDPDLSENMSFGDFSCVAHLYD